MGEIGIIKFNCPHCNKTYKTEFKFAGMSFRCKQCRKIIEIPYRAPTQPPPPPNPFAADDA